MKIVLDIEANGLNPDKIWVIVCKDIDKNEYHIFRKPTDNLDEADRFKRFASKASLLIGHNLLGFDIPVLVKLINFEFDLDKVLDTLIISKLVDYPRPKHSLEDYGREFGLEKIEFNDWSKYSLDMETYCIRDVDINHKVYTKYIKYINNKERKPSILLEHYFQYKVINSLSNNGFYINRTKLNNLLNKVTKELSELDNTIHSSFPSKLKLIREVNPKATKYNTISLSSIPKVLRSNIHEYTIDAPFSYCKWEAFNPSSHKQIIEVLHQAGWKPEDKTETHKDTERELNILQRSRIKDSEFDIKKKALYSKLTQLEKTGWKINEHNLDTLPPSAPAPARSLAQRILLEARRRTLTEWAELLHIEIEIDKTNFIENGTRENLLILNGDKENKNNEESTISKITKLKSLKEENTTLNTLTDYRSKMLIECLKSKNINVQFVKENASYLWIIVTGQTQLENFSAEIATATLAGTKPIPLKYKIISQRIHGQFQGLGAWTHRCAHRNPNTANIPNEFDTQGKKKLYGKELRSMWGAPKNRLLVGCDAEGIQLRIFAHYIDDPEFTQALINGKKEDKSDPHSLNQSILGDVCKSRAAAKRYIYALLLGAGQGKLREILDCDEASAQEAYDRLLKRYTGYAELKETIIPADAKRGWFVGLDGRAVRIPGDSLGSRRHLAMSGYLQNGEAVAMKLATLKWVDQLKEYDAKLVNFVHDEWQVECPNNVDICLKVCHLMADSLRQVGEELNLKCPLAGSYWNDDLHDYTIGTNWSVTH